MSDSCRNVLPSHQHDEKPTEMIGLDGEVHPQNNFSVDIYSDCRSRCPFQRPWRSSHPTRWMARSESPEITYGICATNNCNRWRGSRWCARCAACDVTNIPVIAVSRDRVVEAYGADVVVLAQKFPTQELHRKWFVEWRNLLG